MAADDLAWLRNRHLDSYEIRPVSYMSLVCRTPARIDSGLSATEIGELLRAIRHTESYADFGISCELREWDDRANAEDCWRAWWKTGRSWIEPYDGCDECDPFGDSFDCVCI